MKKSLSDGSDGGQTNGHAKTQPPSPDLHGNASRPRAISIGSRLRSMRRGVGRRRLLAVVAILVAL